MKPTNNPIIPCLCFDDQVEEALQFYGEVFSDLTITVKFHSSEESQKRHELAEEKVLSIVFTMHGQKFLALNGGPIYTQ